MILIKRIQGKFMDENNIESNNESKLDNIESKLDNKDRAYATGKRKNSIARVWLKKGEGKITINGKSLNKYFAS